MSQPGCQRPTMTNRLLERVKPDGRTEDGAHRRARGSGVQQQAIVHASHNVATVFAWEALAALRLGTSDGDKRYNDWFSDLQYKDTVTAKYASIYTTLIMDPGGNTGISYDCSGSGCQSTWIAYTQKGGRVVYLCPSFLQTSDWTGDTSAMRPRHGLRRRQTVLRSRPVWEEVRARGYVSQVLPHRH